MIYLKKIQTAIINYIPFFMVAVTLITSSCYYFDFYLIWIDYLPDLLGYSILTNIVFLRLYQRKAYCNPTKVCVYGLLLMNVISIITMNTKYYSSLYDISIGTVILILVIVGSIKKW